MPRIDGVDLLIFDCDGVLVDSEELACRAVAETLAAIGQVVSAEEIAARFIGISNKDMVAALERDRREKLPASFAGEMNRCAAALFERELKPIAGVAEVVPALAPRCVASSSGPEMLARKLLWTGLAPWFGDAVFSAAAVPLGKPAPDLFLHAAERMAAHPAHCLVIEDSVPGILAAKAAGMTAFGFIGGSHCRAGHGERLAAAGADLVFADMLDLPRLAAQRKATFTTS
jgi:HAD superfamily hydrolase (TIGR01509 family)